MKNILPFIIAVVTLLTSNDLIAAEISVYRDKDGVLNLTDRPVPAGIRVQHVIRYKGKSPAEPDQRQQHVEQKRLENEKIRRLRDKAVQARREAEAESDRARKKIRAAEEYLKQYKIKRKSQRRRYRKQAREITSEAEQAQARANAAIDRANQAINEFQETSPPPADNKE